MEETKETPQASAQHACLSALASVGALYNDQPVSRDTLSVIYLFRMLVVH